MRLYEAHARGKRRRLKFETTNYNAIGVEDKHRSLGQMVVRSVYNYYNLREGVVETMLSVF